MMIIIITIIILSCMHSLCHQKIMWSKHFSMSIKIENEKIEEPNKFLFA